MTTTKSRVTIIDCGSAKVPDIVRAIENLDAAASVITPGQLPAIASRTPAAIIISGNPALICDSGTDFLHDFDVLRTLELPILGICFGHQVIGMLYGAEVTMGKEDRELRRVEILQTKPLFGKISADSKFQQDHTEEIPLPQGFTRLATSSHCFNEAMMHCERPLYGVQFHPETSGEAGEQLFANFLSLVKN